MSEHRPALVDELRQLPAAAWVLFVGTVINRFGSFVVPFLVLYLTQRGFTAYQAGVALGAYGAGHLIAAFVGGQLADVFGRNRTIALSMFTSAASMLALSQASSLNSVVALAFAAGATAELYRPASSALIADLVPPEHRVTAYAVYRLAINLGVAAGPATAGFLAAKSFVAVFVVDAVTSIAFGCLALLYLPRGRHSEDSARGWSAAVRIALADRPFALFLLAATFVAIVDFQMLSTLALHVRDAGFSPAVFGALVSVNGLLIICIELAITRWTRRFEPRLMIAAGWLLICFGFALTGIAHTVAALVATVVIWTFGEMICAPLTTVAVADAAPADLRGRYMGMFSLTWSVGMMVGPPVGTILYARNPALVWWACALLGVAAALIVALTGRRRSDVRSIEAA